MSRNVQAIIIYSSLTDSKKKSGYEEREQVRLSAWDANIQEQLVALANALNIVKMDRILFLAEGGSTLCGWASKNGFECLHSAHSLSLWNMARIWKWQKKASILNIYATGCHGLKIARQIKKICGKKPGAIYGLFYAPAIKPVSGTCFPDILIYESDAAKKNIPDSAKDRFFCLPGMDLNKWTCHHNNIHSKANFIFGMAESLCTASGALAVVRAMSAIWQIEELPRWEIRMFGDGHRFQSILDEAVKLGVASRLSILNSQPLNQTAALCDAWLAPGHSSFESPVTLWAGLAAGIPVISSSTTLHQNWLPDQPPVSLEVEPESPQSLAFAMLEVIKRPELREKLVLNGQRWRNNISLEAMSKRLCEIITHDS